MTTYTPAAGTVAARVVAWLQARPTGEYNAAQIAEALKIDPKIIASSLEVALREKLVFHRQRDRTSPRAPWWYSARDREEHARRNGFAAAATWMPAPKKDSTAGPPASDGAASEGKAVTPGPSQLEAAPDTPQGDQPRSERGREVMEPEACESAAGRGTNGAPALATLPQHASPGVGPMMGAGQPADAGPTRDVPVFLNPAPNAAQPFAPSPTVTVEIGGSEPPRNVHLTCVRCGVTAVMAATARPSACPCGRTEWRLSTADEMRLPPAEQRREVDAQFAASLRAAMDFGDDDDALARGAELGRREDHLPAADLATTRRAVRAPHEPVPLAFRAARFTDGTLATERDGIVVAVYSAAEVDAIQKLLGVRG